MEWEFDAAALWSCGTMELLGYDAVSMEFGTVELWDYGAVGFTRNCWSMELLDFEAVGV